MPLQVILVDENDGDLLVLIERATEAVSRKSARDVRSKVEVTLAALWNAAHNYLESARASGFLQAS
jgi:hypothetical protein